MNKKSIIEFETGKNKGLFISVPYIYKNFKIEQYSKRFGTYLMETNSNSLNHWKMKIPNGCYEIVGLSNQIELELVESEIGIPFKDYIKILNEKDITVNYSDTSNFWLIVLLTEC